ncbi:family 16 glycosylhydrolase [Sunxiuqinia sp. sy24]|uniref:family 16 glycosylhydrolase n=1 Tax=Sunxiuqinia sp. sy24 TaxID=3461495 RepID=UPI004045201B
MKYFIPVFLLFFLGLSTPLKAQQDCENLVWSDEFSTDGAPSEERWGYDTGGGGWGNNELQTYTNTRANSWVENGNLYIKAIKSSNNWTSARLITKGKGDWLYGRIEVRAKLPLGKGTWPAIWMLPTDWEYGGWPASGEIDIMEHVGYDPGVVHGTIHTEAYNHGIGTQKGGSITIDDAMANFHVYAMEWTDETMRWYVDDELYFTFNNENKTYKEWPFDKRFHLLLNIAIGGNWGGAEGIDPNLTEATMTVDYVRVYANKLPQPVVQGSNLNSMNDEVSYSVDAVEAAQYNWLLPEGVTLLSGEGTSSITVQWNDAPGDIQVEVSTACDAVVSNVFHVDYLIKPNSDRFDVAPVNEAQELLWQANAGTDNSLVLAEADGVLLVDFDIADPSQNAYFSYNFNGLIDLTAHNELALDLKVDPANPPSNLRFDLVDVNGNVELVDLFKMESFGSDDSFHFHYHHFSSKADGSFLLGKIAQIRIYVNYGIFGKTGSGRLQIQNLRLQAATSTAVDDPLIQSELKVYPNPAQQFVNIDSSEALSMIQLFSMSGQLLVSKSGLKGKNYQLDLSGLKAGVYLLKVNQLKTELISIH